MNDIKSSFAIVAAEFIKSVWIKRAQSAETVAAVKSVVPNYDGDTEPHYPGAITEFIETEIDGVPVVFAMRIRLATKQMEDSLTRR